MKKRIEPLHLRYGVVVVLFDGELTGFGDEPRISPPFPIFWTQKAARDWIKRRPEWMRPRLSIEKSILQLKPERCA